MNNNEILVIDLSCNEMRKDANAFIYSEIDKFSFIMGKYVPKYQSLEFGVYLYIPTTYNFQYQDMPTELSNIVVRNIYSSDPIFEGMIQANKIKAINILKDIIASAKCELYPNKDKEKCNIKSSEYIKVFDQLLKNK